MTSRTVGVSVALAGVALAGAWACSTDEFSATDAGVDAAIDTGSGDGGCVTGCPPVVIASKLDGPYGIALVGSTMFVTEFVPHGRVLQLDISSTSAPKVLASEGELATLVNFPQYVSKPFFVAATPTDVFWSDLGGLASGFTKLFRSTKGGADAGVQPYYDICAQGEIAADALFVFWANQGSSPNCTQQNEPGQNGLFRGDLPSAGHQGSVYYQDDAGSAPIPNAIAMYDNRVFVGAGKQLLIYDTAKVNNPLGATDALVGGSRVLPAAPYGIAADVENVVWTDFTADGNVSLLKKTAPEGATPVVLASLQGSPLGITIDDPGNYVYFTNYAAGTLMRVKKTGGTPETLAANLDHPAFLTSDKTNLYWTNFGTAGQSNGTVMRLAKPAN